MENNKKIKVKVIAKGNSISAKFSLLGTNSFRHYTKNRITRNTDPQTLKEGYTFSIKVTDFSDILTCSELSLKDIIIDSNSIETFYGFTGDKDYLSKNLTKGFIENWLNYDCPTLYRYDVNINDGQTWLGLKPFLFSDNLVECSFYGVSVSDTIEEEELKSLLKYTNPEGTVHEKIKSILDSKSINVEDVESAYLTVKEYESKVQKIINEHKEDLEHKFGDVLNKNMGFDCGWIYIYTNNEIYKAAKKIVMDAPKEINQYKGTISEQLDVDIPLFTQSTTIQREMFDFLKPYLEELLNDKFYCLTHLD